MPDSFDLNNQPRAADAVAQIPTSSSEVSVRTMASDLELMGQSGGMVSQAAPQPMQVPVTLHPEAEAQSGSPGPSRSSGAGKIIFFTVLIVLGMLGLFALGYFVIGR